MSLTITINSTEYDVIQETERLIIKNCRLSVLALLDVKAVTAQDPLLDQREYVLLDYIWAKVYFENDNCIFDTSTNSKDTPTLDLVKHWIDFYFYAIQAMGHEVLQVA